MNLSINYLQYTYTTSKPNKTNNIIQDTPC